MMIVVAILGILASLATVGFKRYLARARTTEAAAMLGEIAAKELIYFQEFGAYLPLRADGNITLPSPDEGAAAFYPLSPNDATFDSARLATSINDPTAWPAAWRGVGLRPKDPALYCTYMANAGMGGQAVPAGFGTGLVPVPGAPWFYALAACNLTGPAGFPGEVSVFGISSAMPTVRGFNDGF